MIEPKRHRFSILDPLRLVAAFAVVFYHYSVYLDMAWPTFVNIFKYGYLGVNFFFLLSGFVVMASAQNRGPFEFAFARALRIYPAFIICLLFTVLVCYVFSSPRFSFEDILLNGLIINDYVGVPNIDGVYWTLQAELKFYGCMFALLLTGLYVYWRYWLGIWLIAAITYHFYGQPFFLGWVINPTYSFYFIGGTCAYLINRHHKDVYVHVLFFISFAFSVLIAKDQAHDFLAHVGSGEIVIVRCLVSLFYIFFYLLSKGFFDISSSRFLVTAGLLSYPLYLIHNRAGKAIIDNYLGEANIGLVFTVVVAFLIVVSVAVLKTERLIQHRIRGRMKTNFVLLKKG